MVSNLCHINAPPTKNNKAGNSATHKPQKQLVAIPTLARITNKGLGTFS